MANDKWILTNPIDVGDLDDDDLTEIRIVAWHVMPVAQRVDLELEYGRRVDGIFVRGVQPKTAPTMISFQGQQYAQLVPVIAQRHLFVKAATENLIPPGAVA